MAVTMTSLIDGRFESAVATRRSEWTLLESGTRALDVTNHVLRVVLQLGRLQEFVAEFEALVDHQLEDGGWPDLSSGKRSGVRNTCFAARNVIRANRTLTRREFGAAIERAVHLVLDRQDRAGFWPDSVWGPRDATSSGMGLLLYAVQEDFEPASAEIHGRTHAALRAAKEHLELTQSLAGGWTDEDAYEAPVGPTAHLLPKLALLEAQRTPAVGAAADYLLSAQEPEGSWDRGHTDHTCDATRALLLVNSLIPNERIRDAVEKGVAWLLGVENVDGLWGEHAGEDSSLLITCDVLDCLSKYQAHTRQADLRAFWQ